MNIKRADYRQVFHTSLAGLLICASLLAFSTASAEEQAFIRTTDGPDLQWGPCPDFMPPGCELAVLQGDPGKHNADIFFKLPGNSTAARHWHTSAERLVLVSGELHVNYDGQEAVVMNAGTYAYGPAKLPHGAACRSSDPCVLFIAFEEPVDAIPAD